MILGLKHSSELLPRFPKRAVKTVVNQIDSGGEIHRAGEHRLYQDHFMA